MSIVKDSFLLLGAKAAEAIINIFLLIVLARLLSPGDFGMFAIVLAVQSFFKPLIDMGLNPAYIKVKDPSVELQNSFFTINLFLGGLNVVILLAISPMISIWYNADILIYLISIFSISVMLSSISKQGYAQLTRDKQFNKILIISLLTNIVTSIVSLYFAFQGYGVWVLIIKSITLNFIMAVLVHVFIDKRYSVVSWRVIRKFTKELKFGVEIFINRLLTGFFNASDKLIFGKFFGVDLLGQYSNAQQVSRMGDVYIRTPITNVVYSYAERHSKSNKHNFYDDFSSFIFLITSIFSGLLIINGGEFIGFILGEKWAFASEYIYFLGFFSMGVCLQGILTVISMSENTMKIMIKKVFISNVLMLFIFLATFYFNLESIAFVRLFSIVIFLYWLLSIIFELKKYSSINSFLLSIILVFLSLSVAFLSKKNMLYSESQELIITSTIFVLPVVVYLIIQYNFMKKRG
jgi:O-antigen/teichoic acid export membrane protein